MDVLNISKSNYYKYYKQIDKDYDEYLLIKEIFDESKGTYGYRRIEKGLLQKWGLIMNHKKVQRIMKKYHLKPQYTKRIKNKSYKRIEENVKPNLVNRNFNTDSPNRIWTTDITYLILNNKRAYLSTILDLYDRKIVAYKISYRNDLNIVIDTLNEAINKRKDVKGLIIHSDQGFQYTNIEYIRYLDEHGVTISHSRKANCYDNACCENFFGHLKSEYLELQDIPKTNDELIAMVDKYIYFYNYERPQRKLKGMTPIEYRQSYLNSL